MSSLVFQTSITVVSLLLLLPLNNAALVLDVDGEPIRNGGDYFIVPVDSGGNLTYIRRRHECPLFITEGVGTPVKISTPLKIAHISLGESVDLAFTGSVSDTLCKESLVWQLSLNAWERRQYITTGGGAFNRPFEITKRDKSGKPTYKLSFCVFREPDVCFDSVGLYEDNGLLGITSHSNTFSFKKAFDVPELSTS